MSQPICAPRKKRVVASAVASFVEPLEQRVLFSRVLGIDVSEFQGTINWSTVKNSSGKGFAYIRATYGVSSVDNDWPDNAINAANAGMIAGYYHYAYYDLSGHTPQGEADHFWDNISPYMAADGKHLQPMVDIEESGAPSNGQTLSQWINSFCDRLVSDGAADGLALTPIIYCNVNDSSRLVGGGSTTDTVTEHHPRWVAQYPGTLPNPQTAQPTTATPWQESKDTTNHIFNYSGWAIWQYSSSGSVAGISGNVDLDVLQGDTNILKDYIVGSTGRWAVGTRVQAGASLNVWDTGDANGTVLGTHNSPDQGTIIGGPVYGNSFIRWHVNFDTGVDGWVAEYQSTNIYTSANIEWLKTVTPAIVTNPNPANSTSPVNTLPSTFTWTAGANDTGYKVYLDGTLRATVSTNSWTHTPIGQGSHTWRVDATNGELTTTGTTWNFNYDSIAPSAPSTPTLATDTGFSSTDNLTSDNTPTFTGTAEANSTLKLYRDGTTLIGTAATGSNGQWSVNVLSSLLDGTYAITATATDAAGNTSAASTAVNITIDTLAPVAAYGGETPNRGDTTLDFTITYSDANGIDFGTIDGSDITVTGPNGYSAAASFVSIDQGSNGSPRVATYRINAPGGSWTLDDNGTYTVSANASQVNDVAGNALATGQIDTFTAAIPFAYQNGASIHIDFDGSANPITVDTSGANYTVTQLSTTYSFPTASITDIDTTGTSADDHLIINSGNFALSLNGGEGNDLLDVNGGSVTFATDASVTTHHLAIDVAGGASALFNSTQHLAALNLAGGNATLAADGSQYLDLGALTVAATSALDLNDNDLIVQSGDFSTIQALVFGGYRQSADPTATGIISTTGQTAPSNPILALFSNSFIGSPDYPFGSGNTISANAIVGKYTYFGDTNWDGQVTADDYGALDANFGTTGIDPGVAWFQGDTNFDGQVTADDYGTLDANFGAGAGNPLSATSAPTVMQPSSPNPLPLRNDLMSDIS